MQRRDPRGEGVTRAITRRRFLRESAAGAAALGATSSSASPVTKPAPAASRVIIVTHPDALVTGSKANPATMPKMLEAGIKALTGKQTDKEAWQRIAQPGQRVTMKWNEMGGRLIRTHPEMRSAVADALVTHGGLGAAKVVQFSRREIQGPTAEVVQVPIPSFGKPAKLRRLFTDFTDCLVNLPVLKVHRGKGVCISLKNHFGSILNPKNYHYWEEGMGKAIVELNLFSAIRDKTRLIICDALRPQWDLGPVPAPGRRWNLNALIFGFDPVAVDAVGLDILERKRKTIGSLSQRWQLPYAREMLAYGQEKGLGVADLARIEIERIDLKG